MKIETPVAIATGVFLYDEIVAQKERVDKQIAKLD
jgi:hypothetical protein